MSLLLFLTRGRIVRRSKRLRALSPQNQILQKPHYSAELETKELSTNSKDCNPQDSTQTIYTEEIEAQIMMDEVDMDMETDSAEDTSLDERFVIQKPPSHSAAPARSILKLGHAYPRPETTPVKLPPESPPAHVSSELSEQNHDSEQTTLESAAGALTISHPASGSESSSSSAPVTSKRQSEIETEDELILLAMDNCHANDELVLLKDTDEAVLVEVANDSTEERRRSVRFDTPEELESEEDTGDGNTENAAG